LWRIVEADWLHFTLYFPTRGGHTPLPYSPLYPSLPYLSTIPLYPPSRPRDLISFAIRSRRSTAEHSAFPPIQIHILVATDIFPGDSFPDICPDIFPDIYPFIYLYLVCPPCTSTSFCRKRGRAPSPKCSSRRALRQADMSQSSA
jgi:hypothetical protein